MKKIINTIFGAIYCPERIIPNILFALVVLILVGAVFPARLKDEEGALVKKGELIEYEVGGRGPTDIYIRQFDAWKKGQIELDLEVDRRLSALENPYDPAERKSSGARENPRVRDITGITRFSTVSITPISASRRY